MSENSVVDFENRLRASGVLDAQQLAEIDYSHFSDARYLAKRLVEKCLLTEWQAKLLLSGRSQMLVGGYLLLERLERNELGDCYLARHRSLDRNVELQFLPKEFGKKSDQFEPFIQSAQMLIEVDHPNLAHVFDVGEEVGRYFVVQERVSGQTLAEIELTKVSRVEVLGWVRELASAIGYLHRRSILHGSIDWKEIIVTPNRQIQLRGLIKRVLEERVLGHNERPQSDSGQFGLLDRVAFQGLLGELLAKTWGSEANAALLSAVVRLGQNGDSLQEIESLAAREISLLQSSASGIDHLPTTNPQKPADPKSPKGTNPKAQALSPKKDQPTESISKRSTLEKPHNSPKFRKIFIGGVIAVAAFLIGGWAWFQFGLVPANSETEVAKSNSDETMRPPTDSKRGRSSKSNSKTSLAESAPIAEKPLPESASSDVATDVATKDDQGELDSGRDQISQSDSDTPLVDVLDKDSREGVDEENSHPIVDPTEPVKGIGAEGFADLLLGSSTATPASVANSEKDVSKSATKRSSKSEPTTTPDSSAESNQDSTKEQSFMPSVPEGFELPPPDGSGTFVKLMDLNSEAATDVSLDLIFDPEKCGKGKNFFTLSAIPGKKEWNVQHSNRPEDRAAKIVARFKVEGDGLVFAWEPDVDNKSNANFLCNACLEISTTRMQIIPLRKSLNIDSLMLNEKSFSSRTTLEIPWLPAEGIKLEFGQLDPAQFGTGRIANPQMVNRSPATIAFKDDLKEQIFYLAIAADFKAKVEFRLDVQTRNERGAAVSLTPKMLDDVLNGFDRYSEHLFMKKELAQNLADNAQYGEKTKRRDELKAATNSLKEHQTLREIAHDQGVLVRNLVNVPIPLRVVYEFQNQKIELARTPNYQSN
jgi:serine/threonine protein kinase